jgi:hypothetical protein
VLFPDTSKTRVGPYPDYAPISFKILDNTATAVTVEGTIDTADIGQTYAIIYGKLVQSTVVLDDILAYAGTSTGISGAVLTDTTASFSNDLTGAVLIPDTNEDETTYTIQSNTTTTITATTTITNAVAGDIYEVVGIKTGNKTVKFFDNSGTNSFAGGTAAATYTGICEVCHTQTTHFRNDGSGSDNDHTNMGSIPETDCTACHSHVDGFKPSSECVDCHNVAKTGGSNVYQPRQIVEDSGDGGGDFVKASRHVNNGTTTQIVISYDCVVCHAEGDADAVDAGTGWTSSLHNDNSTSTTRMVNLRNVDDYDSSTTFNFNKNTIDETMRDNMDTFCMTCHDSDGANTISVNNTNDGLYLGTTETTTIRTGSTPVAQRPFNTDDNLQNANDSFTTRTRVIDVYNQYDTSNPSHHAVRGARYSSKHSDSNSGEWDTATWTDYTLKDAAGSTMSTIKETATLHCADCHLSEQNAHGAVNAWHMLRNGVAAGTCWDPSITRERDCDPPLVWTYFSFCVDPSYTDRSSCEGASLTWEDPDDDTVMAGTDPENDGPFSLNCYKCHNAEVYRGDSNLVAGSRFTHNDDTDWFSADYGGGTNNAAYLGPACLNCHSGEGFGHIHGRGSSTDSDNGTYADDSWSGSNSYTKYRFMPGAWMYWSPRAGGPTAPADDGAWNTTASGNMCYFPASQTSWSACTSHSNSQKSSGTNYARPTSY